MARKKKCWYTYYENCVKRLVFIQETGQNISTKMIHHGLQEWAKFQFNQCKSQLETTKWIFQ